MIMKIMKCMSMHRRSKPVLLGGKGLNAEVQTIFGSIDTLKFATVTVFRNTREQNKSSQSASKTAATCWLQVDSNRHTGRMRSCCDTTYDVHIY